MPLRDYECADCNSVTELLDRDERKCCRCGSGRLRKVVSRFAVAHGPTNEFRRHLDRERRRGEMRQDLRDNHGIHAYQPLPNSEHRDFEQVYKDIKKLGGKVKDEMQASRARNAALTRQKQRKWMEGALKRTRAKKDALMRKHIASKKS